MGRTRHAKRKLPVTAPISTRAGPIGDKLPASASSTATRTVIRQFHVLMKRREQLLRKTSGKNQGSKSAANGRDYEELAQIEQEMEMLGGLERYQAMSSIGQSVTKGGGSEKVLASWLKELRTANKDVDSRLRLLDVGALKHDNYSSSKSFIEATPIDLHSRHPHIIEQDFMKIDPNSSLPFHQGIPSNKDWDVISLSLVLNFVPDPYERGQMLHLAHTLLATDGLLFVVLPLPCLLNSRYLTIQHWTLLMATVGFSLLKERWKEGGKVGYWLFQKVEIPKSVSKREVPFSKKTVLKEGASRNNFCILIS